MDVLSADCRERCVRVMQGISSRHVALLEMAERGLACVGHARPRREHAVLVESRLDTCHVIRDQGW
jgi:hypothetical protein